MTPRRVLLALVPGIVGLSVAVALVAAVLARVQETETRYRMIAEAMTVPSAAETIVDWSHAPTGLARPFTAYDRVRIGQALTEAWAALALSQDLGDTTALADHFSGTALERAGIAAAIAQDQGTRMAILGQTLAPRFYHLDGSLLQVEGQTLAVRYTHDEGAEPTAMLSADRTVTTLMNESSGWRVVSHERTASTPIETRPRPLDLPRLVGVNYYPAETPWRAFWPGYDRSVIARDLERILGLGANTVRIFLPREGVLDPVAGPGLLRDLGDFLAQAQAAGLFVIPTLFDLRGGYAPTTWADDRRYLDLVAPVLAASPAVVAIDIKNEPDLDFEAHGRATVLAWAQTMAHLVRQRVPGAALTIGWAAPEAAALLVPVLDIVSYHDYQPLAGVAARLETVRRQAQGRPVLVTEIGSSSFDGLLGFPGSQAEQARALSDRIAALERSDGVLVWALHDFTRVDPAAIGGTPWNRALQRRFGLFDETGDAKPAAQAVAEGFVRFLRSEAR